MLKPLCWEWYTVTNQSEIKSFLNIKLLNIISKNLKGYRVTLDTSELRVVTQCIGNAVVKIHIF